MPLITLPLPSELPREGGQILKFPIIKKTPLGDSIILTVVFKQMFVFGQSLKLDICVPADSLPYVENNFLCVQVTVLGALAYHTFTPLEFALFYEKVLFKVLPPGYRNPRAFQNAVEKKQQQPSNPFPLFLSSIPHPLGGGDLD